MNHIQVCSHMARSGRPSQREHANLHGKPKDNLSNRLTMPMGYFRHGWLGKRLVIRSEQRESLVGDPIVSAKLPHLSIPAHRGVAAVLDKAWPNPRVPAKRLQLLQCHVADSQSSSATANMNRFHRAPGFPILGGQAKPLTGPM